MGDIVPRVIHDASGKIIERNDGKRGGDVHSVNIPKRPVDLQGGIGVHQGIHSGALHDSRNTIRKFDQSQRVNADIPSAGQPEARDGTVVGRGWQRWGRVDELSERHHRWQMLDFIQYNGKSRPPFRITRATRTRCA